MTPPEKKEGSDRRSEGFAGDEETVQQLSGRIQRRQKGRDQKARPLWFGLGMFGLVGWSIAVPTILGLVLGLWLDRVFESNGRWTLVCLLAGMALGCFNAWHWVHQSALRQETGEDTSESDVDGDDMNLRSDGSE